MLHMVMELDRVSRLIYATENGYQT